MFVLECAKNCEGLCAKMGLWDTRPFVKFFNTSSRRRVNPSIPYNNKNTAFSPNHGMFFLFVRPVLIQYRLC